MDCRKDNIMYTRKSIRLISLFLALFLLTSCGGTTGETDAALENEPAAETVAETEPPEYILPEVDYDGETFTVGAVDYYSQGGGVWKAQDYCEAYADATGDPLHDAIFERNNIIEEELNVNLEAYSFSKLGNVAGGELKTLVLAGETIVDLASLPGQSMPAVLSAGICMDLHDITTVDFTKSWWDATSVETFDIMGTLYAATGDFCLNTAFSPITYFFSKQLAEQHHLEDPYTLVKEGKWTLDASIKMAETVSTDVNGNGTADILEDHFGIMLESVSMTSAILAGGVHLTEKDADGKPVLAVDQELAANIVEKLQPFFFNDKVTMHNGRINGYGNVFTELFLPAFQENRGLFYNNQLLVALDLREMDADFGILPHPKYNEEQAEYYGPVNYHWATFEVVPITNGRPDMTGHMMDALGYHSQQIVTPTYVEKTIQGKTLRDEESIEMLDLILDSRVYDLASIYDWGGISSMFNELGNSATKQFASTYAGKEKGAVSAIEKTITEIEALG